MVKHSLSGMSIHRSLAGSCVQQRCMMNPWNPSWPYLRSLRVGEHCERENTRKQSMCMPGNSETCACGTQGCARTSFAAN